MTISQCEAKAQIAANALSIQIFSKTVKSLPKSHATMPNCRLRNEICKWALKSAGPFEQKFSMNTAAEAAASRFKRRGLDQFRSGSLYC